MERRKIPVSVCLTLSQLTAKLLGYQALNVNSYYPSTLGAGKGDREGEQGD